MREAEVIVVGGGPAGAACAWRLVRRGIDVLVLDLAEFPRLKLCAGWVTPDVLDDLELDEASYPHRLLTFETLDFHAFGRGMALRCRQHSVRRYEFDAWLLERSGAPVVNHRVRDIRRDGDGYVIDDSFRCRWLVGAGGTRCPVYRGLFRERNPRSSERQVVTFEHEFACQWDDPRCHLWFFEHGLPGYAWYVPKRDGWLNIGVGGMASTLKRKGDDIKRHWRLLGEKLERDGLLPRQDFDASGYSYYVRDRQEVVQHDNAFLCGDAAGLATVDMGEGIGPAIASGLRAADAITSGTEYHLRGIARRSLPGILGTHPWWRRLRPGKGRAAAAAG